MPAESLDSEAGSVRHLLASGIMFQGQEANFVRNRVSADAMVIAPRGFGAFNFNSVNELLLENSHIESYPGVEDDETSGAGRRMTKSGSYPEDISDMLRDFADTLPKKYGHISRIRMHPVHITLHGAGKNGSTIHVVADELVKEFKDDSQPELIDVRVYDDQSPKQLSIPKARWDTQTGQFIVNANTD